VRLQFLSLPSGVVKDCHRAQKLAKESEQERNGGGDGEWKTRLPFTTNRTPSKFRGLFLRGELKLGLQRGKHQRDCTFA
jgi:hypothetical protein